jgi:hypothetical protein
MSDEDQVGGGFGWGLLVGVALGLALGAFLASGAGRGQVENLRARTIELTGSARRAASDPDSAMRRAIQDGINAARRRREELEAEAGRSQPGVVDGSQVRDA